jgi:hypothetical protein
MIGKNNPDAIHAFPQDARSLIQSGKEWFEGKSEQIRQNLCPQFKKAELENVVSEELVALVFAYLGSAYGHALATYLAALVVKRIVSGWCD